ncbi:MAG: MarR family transcriptional regulator [Clostridia bacterium]|nr:MarR family transcriptional regulator [Clostridia bacterium]
MFDINEQMTYLVYVMQKKMRRQLTNVLDRDDITLEQYVVLYNLVGRDGINQKTLSHSVDKDQATLARILDILEGRDYIIRRTTEKDRRAFLVFITDKGRVKVKEIAKKLGEVHGNIIEGIPDDKVDQFIELIKMMIENLDRLSRGDK